MQAILLDIWRRMGVSLSFDGASYPLLRYMANQIKNTEAKWFGRVVLENRQKDLKSGQKNQKLVYSEGHNFMYKKSLGKTLMEGSRLGSINF